MASCQYSSLVVKKAVMTVRCRTLQSFIVIFPHLVRLPVRNRVSHALIRRRWAYNAFMLVLNHQSSRRQLLPNLSSTQCKLVNEANTSHYSVSVCQRL
jgi:hypothetical protein